MKRFLIALALLAAGTVDAAPADFQIDPENTQVLFEVRHFGTSTSRGRFTEVSASIALDPAARRGSLSVTIGTAGVDSGVKPLDAMLRGDWFLAAKAHPQAYFVATDLSFDGDRLVQARGEFTLRGVSRPLTLRALRFACGPRAERASEVCGGDFEAEFKRSDFGITYGLPFVDDRVRLVIQVEASRPAAGLQAPPGTPHA